MPKYHEIGGSQGYFLSSRKCQKSCRMSNTNFLLQTLEVCIWIHICTFWVLGQNETFSLFIANKRVSSFFALTSVVKMLSLLKCIYFVFNTSFHGLQNRDMPSLNKCNSICWKGPHKSNEIN